MTRLLLAALLMLCTAKAGAAAPITERQDTATVQTEQQPDTVKKKKGLINWVLNYINNTNKNKKHKKFDFSVLPGPHFSSDTGFGIGVIGMGLYRQDRRDTVSQMSDVAIFGDITTKSSYTIGVFGTHVFPYNRGRIEYDISANYFKEKFWGMGYDMGNEDSNEGMMKRWKITAKANFLWQVARNVFVGPSLTYDYAHVNEIDRPELMEGQDGTLWNLGVGFTIAYDTRDIITRPTSGVYATVSQLFHPKFMGSGYAYTTTDFRFNTYAKLWRGAVVAGDLRGTLNFGDPSWATMALLGNSSTMRGYYKGRYRDKHKMEAEVELRQHVWKRNGIAVWAGVGTVFGKFSAIHFDRLLPNWGVGYRWEFKKNGNIRLDYGFGKSGLQGFVFNINEAF